jgi:hypothetical protein
MAWECPVCLSCGTHLEQILPAWRDFYVEEELKYLKSTSLTRCASEIDDAALMSSYLASAQLHIEEESTEEIVSSIPGLDALVRKYEKLFFLSKVRVFIASFLLGLSLTFLISLLVS